MHLNRAIKIRLVVLLIIAVIFVWVMAFGYARVPRLLGMGYYTVNVELPKSGGLYETANVTYRGTQVGKVKSVNLTGSGTVVAVLSLKESVKIPSNLEAQVHSQTAVGEQYIELAPRDSTSAPLKSGDVIPAKDTTIPPPIDELLDATDRGLQAIPQDNLKTVVDESYTAFGGLGPELARIVKGATTLASDARANLDSLTTLIDESGPILDTQTETSDSVQAWAANLAAITDQLRNNDNGLAGVIDNGGPVTAEARQLVERLQPTLPVILANLVTVGNVAVTYQPALEQLLVLIPQSVAMLSAASTANKDVDDDFRGPYLDFNLNFNLPPPCTTGFLPASQRRTPVQEDAPDPPPGDIYCRTPQDGPFNVRGAKNLPCLTVPGKRAPTVKMCESDEQYVPLNDGFNWKGDPNATLSGQPVPQLPAGTTPPGPSTVSAPAAPSPTAALPPLTVAEYDPATGSYVGPDGKIYTQSDLAQTAPEEKTWQSMLTPPTQN